jgi:CubicO group peptidase (beta-lactamase class C family)
MLNDKVISISEGNVNVNPKEVGYHASQLEVLDKHLLRLIERKRIQAASYLISKDSKVFAQKSMGNLLYNDDSKQFMPDSIRKIASITKLFVAVSIMQLVEKGIIRIDQRVSEIIDEFKTPMFEKITIFNLLTHTSGIRPEPGAFFEPYPIEWDFFNSRDWIKGILRDFAAVEPGKEWRYSSAGFTILGEIVTRVSGVHFEKYVIKNIVQPLGMNNTFFDIPDELRHKICLNNEWEEKWLEGSKERPEWAPPRSGGGLFSTLEDFSNLGKCS